MYRWEMSSVCIIQRYIHQHTVNHWRISQNVQHVLALQTLFQHQHYIPEVAPHLFCVALIILNLSPGFRHSQYSSRTAKITGIQRTRPQRKCVFSCSVCYFCSFGGMRMFLFLELEFSLGLQRLIVRGTETVQECNHFSLCHSNFTHKTLLYMFTC